MIKVSDQNAQSHLRPEHIFTFFQTMNRTKYAESLSGTTLDHIPSLSPTSMSPRISSSYYLHIVGIFPRYKISSKMFHFLPLTKS